MNNDEKTSVSRLAVRFIVFLCIGLPAFYGLHEWFYWRVRDPISGVLYAQLARVVEPQPYSRIILGDSVARQLYKPGEEVEARRLLHLTTNAATTMLGQFILVMEYLRFNRCKEIIILMNPYSLGDDLNRIYTANYVVGPLYRKRYLPYWDQRSIDQVKNTPFWWGAILLRRFPEFCLLDYRKVNPKPFEEDSYPGSFHLENPQMYITALAGSAFPRAIRTCHIAYCMGV